MKALIACLVVLIVVLGFVLQPDATKPVVQTLPIQKAAEPSNPQPEALEPQSSAARTFAGATDSTPPIASRENERQIAPRSHTPAVIHQPQARPSDLTVIKSSPDHYAAAAEQNTAAPKLAHLRPSLSLSPALSFSPSPLAGLPAIGNSQDILVPTGGRLPAALIDLDQNTPEQAQAADGIAEAFLNGVSDETAEIRLPQRRPAKDAGAARERAWEAARAEADERYRQLFGDEAYKASSNAAAMDALREKQLQAQPR